MTNIVRGEWGFKGWIITDNANTSVFMDAAQMLQAGGDAKLTTLDQSDMWAFNKDDATEYYYAHEAMHHLLYTTVNSHVMNGAAPGASIHYGLQATDKIRIGITAGSVAIIGLVVFTAVRNHKKRKLEHQELAQETASA